MTMCLTLQFLNTASLAILEAFAPLLYRSGTIFMAGSMQRLNQSPCQNKADLYDMNWIFFTLEGETVMPFL